MKYSVIAVEGTKRIVDIDGHVCSYWYTGNVPGQDAWNYRMPDGHIFTHPTQHGCLHMILQHISKGEYLSPVDLAVCV